MRHSSACVGHRDPSGVTQASLRKKRSASEPVKTASPWCVEYEKILNDTVHGFACSGNPAVASGGAPAAHIDVLCMACDDESCAFHQRAQDTR